MDLNLIELYKILANNPEGFRSVIRNIYGSELLRLRIVLKETMSFISQETGAEATRNRFIEDELKELNEEFTKTTILLSYFRYITLTKNDDETPLTCEKARTRLKDLAITTAEAAENFHNTVRKDPDNFNSRLQDIDVFSKMQDNILIILRKADAVLETMDEKLKE